MRFLCTKINIREMIQKLQNVHSNKIYFEGFMNPIELYLHDWTRHYWTYVEKEESYSVWKLINGKPVCRWIHVHIPEEYGIIPSKFIIGNGYRDYLIPERDFNSLFSGFKVNFWSTIERASYFAEVEERWKQDLQDNK